LVCALADYEKLARPTEEATARLHADAFAEQPRFEVLLATDAAGNAIGYAIFFETYSSFLAKPTMYLEDLFVLESARKQGAGGLLFDRVCELGRERGCGRMEWQVLDWNELAQEFYRNRNGVYLSDWQSFRLTY
jgi:GNAT superfamily N-acetyltransferase